MSKLTKRMGLLAGAALYLGLAPAALAQDTNYHGTDTVSPAAEIPQEVPPPPSTDPAATPSPENAAPPPTMDTDNDGTNDGWDRDGDGAVDVWDLDGDGQPDAMDTTGDGQPDVYRPDYEQPEGLMPAEPAPEPETAPQPR